MSSILDINYVIMNLAATMAEVKYRGGQAAVEELADAWRNRTAGQPEGSREILAASLGMAICRVGVQPLPEGPPS